MTTLLQDGLTGRTARIDVKNRLLTFATSQEEEAAAALEGETFTINTGDITLTSANESGVLHIKNTDTVPWIFTRLFFNVGASTGGSGHWRLKVIKNVTAGTLISGGTTITPQNLNFGQAATLTSTSLKGAEGDTVTDGTDVINSIIPGASTRVLIANNPIIVEPGSALSITITPPSGNTSFLTQSGIVLIRSTE